jgi:hypothetical protein
MSAPRFDGLSDLARNRAPDNPLPAILKVAKVCILGIPKSPEK